MARDDVDHDEDLRQAAADLVYELRAHLNRERLTFPGDVMLPAGRVEKALAAMGWIIPDPPAR